MSGIFGVFDRRIEEKSEGISAMLPWNRLYGGDGEGIFEAGNISLGCCVQQLNNLRIQEDFVLHNNGKHAVIDAVIYNRDELLCKCGCDYDLSDPELLFCMVEKNGMKSLSEINGDFAGAIFDEKAQKVTLFRDHMGIRPLYYYVDAKRVAFSTDLRGLFAYSGVKTKIDDEWIFRTVSGYDTETLDSTPYENVSCVTPAHFIEISFDKTAYKLEAHRYWKLGSRKIRHSSQKEYEREMRNLVEDAVHRRLNAVSGLVGAELSGGLDSGVIDILINRMGRKAEFISWSLDPKELEMAENDERKIIDDICRQENITCNFLHASSDFKDKTAHNMEKVGLSVPDDGSIDFRFAFPADSNTFTLIHGSLFVRDKGAKVMFTGHGGDEGISHRSNVYEMFYHHEYYHYFKHIWSMTRKGHRAIRTIKKSIRNIASSMQENRQVYTSWYASPEILNKEFASKYSSQKQYNLQFGYDPIAYIESGGSRNRLENMALLGAHSGVRYMVPYLDYRVIDFAVSIPRYLYINGNTRRYIFREAFKDLMPQSLYKLDNKEETSFNNLKSSEDEWFDEYSRRKREIIDSLDREHWDKYLDYDKIEMLYRSGKPEGDEHIRELRWIKALLKCALAQNLIERAK